MSLKEKISNVIQCRIDIAEQDKEIAIKNELMVLKRELLETINEAIKQIQEKAICGRCLDNEPTPIKGCRFNCETCKVRSKVSQYVYLPHILAFLDGDAEKEVSKLSSKRKLDGEKKPKKIDVVQEMDRTERRESLEEGKKGAKI